MLKSASNKSSVGGRNNTAPLTVRYESDSENITFAFILDPTLTEYLTQVESKAHKYSLVWFLFVQVKSRPRSETLVAPPSNCDVKDRTQKRFVMMNDVQFLRI